MVDVVVVFMALFLGFGVLAGVIAYLETRGSDRRRRNALPAAYSPEAYFTDPEKVPGRCPECYHDNDPSFDFCENCAEELPDVDPTEERSLKELFGTG